MIEKSILEKNAGGFFFNPLDIKCKYDVRIDLHILEVHEDILPQ